MVEKSKQVILAAIGFFIFMSYVAFALTITSCETTAKINDFCYGECIIGNYIPVKGEIYNITKNLSIIYKYKYGTSFNYCKYPGIGTVEQPPIRIYVRDDICYTCKNFPDSCVITTINIIILQVFVCVFSILLSIWLFSFFNHLLNKNNFLSTEQIV